MLSSLLSALGLIKSSKKSFVSRHKLLFIVPLSIVLSLVTVFLISDQFMIYAQLFLFNNDKPKEGTYQGSDEVATYNGEYVTSDNGTGTSTQLVRQSGAAMMLMNNISGSFSADWLTIARDHCNGKYMNENVKWPNGVKCSILFPLGCAMKETDLQTVTIDGVKMTLPHSNIDVNGSVAYGSTVGDSKFDLYTVNSAWLIQNGLNYRDQFFTTSMKRGSYYTQFQMSRNFLSKSADGSRVDGARWPSILNGYKDSGVRNKANSDMAYFPDQISAVIQSGWSRFEENKTMIGTTNIDFNQPATIGIAYAMHNGGQGNVFSWYGVAHKNIAASSGLVDSSYGADIPELGKEDRNTYVGGATADAINQLSAPVGKVIDYLTKNPGALDGNEYYNRTIFEGISFSATLYGLNGFTTEVGKARLNAKLNNDSFKKGAVIGYRAVTGDNNISDDAIISGLRNLDTSEGERYKSYYGTARGGLYNGKYSSDPTVYYYDTTRTMTTTSGAKVKLIHAAVEEPTSGVYWLVAGGSYLYYNMLKYAGVECTFEQAFEDSNGTFIEVAVQTVKTKQESTRQAQTAGEQKFASVLNSTMAADTGTKLASVAVDYAMLSAFDAKKSSGTARYIAINDIVEGSRIYRSCDRGVASAIRYSGVDPEVTMGGTSNIRDYMLKSPRWTKVPYDGTRNTLKPGDVMMRVGHIIMYVGTEIPLTKWRNAGFSDDYIKSQIGYSGKKGGYSLDRIAVVSASFGEYAPAIVVWSSEYTQVGYQSVSKKAKGYDVFRCTNPANSNKYCTPENLAKTNSLDNFNSGLEGVANFFDNGTYRAKKK